MMTGQLKRSAAWAGVCVLALAAAVSAAGKATSTDDPDFKIQGEYVGELGTKFNDKLESMKHGVQVIALGDHKFRAVAYRGGLPGDGWDRRDKYEIEGSAADGVATFVGKGKTEGVTITIKDGQMTIGLAADKEVGGTLKPVVRKGPTQGAKPPEGAIVLFDGTSGSEWNPGDVEDGLLKADVSGGGQFSKRKFQSFTLHVEFMLPFEPKGRGQGRCNSGVYMQGRYETQVLDSFGLSNANNECGGIYTVRDSDVQMCFPPLSWQTYDIDYTAAKYENGKKVKNAVMTVKLNGVLVHKDVEVPRGTTAAPIAEGPEPGPIYLQNHGHPVRFANIWLVEKK